MNNNKKFSLFRDGSSSSAGLTDIPLTNFGHAMPGINQISGLALTARQMQGIVGKQNGGQLMWDKDCFVTDPKSGKQYSVSLTCVPYWACTSWNHGTCGPCRYSECMQT